MTSSKHLLYFFYGILSLWITIIFFTYHDYGITWDEQIHQTYGELVLEYFKSGFRDHRCNHYYNLFLYGSIFDVLSTLIYKTLELPKFLVRHFLISICSILTLIAVFKFGRLFSEPVTSIFIVLCLLMFPRYYGHSFNNGKDIPFACAFAWSILTICRLHISDDKNWKMYIACGASIGFALSIRVGGLILFGYLAAAFSFSILSEMNNPERSKILKSQSPFYLGYCSSLLIAWLMMIAFWPWTHANPLIRPLAAFIAFSNFHHSIPVLFDGLVFSSDSLPRSYIFKYLTVTTPPVLLFLFMLGCLGAILSWIRNWKSNESFLLLVTFLWFIVPIIYMAVTHVNIYDGIRHFLFILPAMAIITGYGGALILKKLRLVVGNNVLSILIISFICLLPAKNHIDLHPFQMTYFNFIVGGLSKAWKNYETDYWTSSYKQAAEWLNDQTEKTPGDKIKVVLAANEFNRVCAEHYLSSNIEVYTFFTGTEDVPDDFDYYVSTTKFGLHKYFPELPVVHSIGKREAVFTVIKKNSKNTHM